MEDNPILYTVENLVADESFQAYCLDTDSESTAYWEDIILANWSQRKVFEQAYDVAVSLGNDRVFDKSELTTKVISLHTPPKSNRRSRIGWKSYSVAVSALILLVIFSFYPQGKEPLTICHVTDYGEVKELLLADSSIVTLNGNSTLSYLDNISEKRVVSLDGEAYFKVKTTSDKANFTVKSRLGNIKVTGTEFNVLHRNSKLDVCLVEGQIVFQKPRMNDITLTPQDHISVEGNTIKLSSDKNRLAAAWTDGRMVFKDASIMDIQQRLLEVYGVEIQVQNKSLISKKINANMVTSDPAVLLESLSNVYGFTTEQVGNTIVLK